MQWRWFVFGTFAMPFGAIWGVMENPNAAHAGGRLLEWLESHKGAVTALATIAIAAFTGTLWWSTHRLWQVTQQSFVATNRPRLTIRAVRGGYAETVEGKAIAEVVVADIGGSEATVTGIARDIAWRQQNSSAIGQGE
jgi:hypothetical protein